MARNRSFIPILALVLGALAGCGDDVFMPEAGEALAVAYVERGEVAWEQLPALHVEDAGGAVRVRPPAPDGYTRTFREPLFHLFDSTGALIRSVGAELTYADEIIAPGAGGTIWTAKRAPYELRQWAQGGSLLRILERATPAFGRAPYVGPWPYVPGDGPRPRLLAVRHDADGRLWTAFRIRRPGADIRVIDDRTLETCCITVLEVLDPANGALLGTATIPFHVYHLLPDEYILAGTTGSAGEPLVVLYRARLTVPTVR